MDETRDVPRWREIERLFLAALEAEPGERRALLAERCDDVSIRREVERMLAADERPDGLLDDPVADLHPLEALLDQAGRSLSSTTEERQTPGQRTPARWGRDSGRRSPFDPTSAPTLARPLGPPTPPAPPTPLAPALEPGNLLANRFQIVRFLAAGGMGEVYEAEDLELGERVAVKTVRTELTTDPRAMDRFRREVQLARRVTHPSVCRIYDIFHHQFPDSAAGRRGADENDNHDEGETPTLTFLSMELLSGETLAERIRRVGRLEPDEALPLVRQICDGLATAHEAGIIHRDLKSSNVLLVPSAKGTRAVVTDFGLARLGGASGEMGPTVTRSGTTLGTPAYMAPEQVKGGTITSATDLYALGVLLYEMVTGRFPFAGEDSLVMAVRRLHEEPTSPREYVADLDPRWERAILRCLRRHPDDRFRTAHDIVDYLDDDSVPAFPIGRRQGGLLLAALLGALLLIALLIPWSRWLSRDQAEPDAGGAIAAEDASPDTHGTPDTSTHGRRAVAVLGFHNLAGQEATDWISTAFSEMLTMELAAGEGLRTIPGENIARMRRDLALPIAASFAPDTLERIRRHLGAHLVVSGGYFATVEGERIRLDLRLEETQSGRSIALFTEEGEVRDLLDLVSRAGQRLRAELELDTPHSSAVSRTLRSALPQRPEAARLFAQGVSRLRHLDALGALELLEQAVRAEPDAPMAHAALASAWSALGHDARAASAARRALDRSQSLPRSERLQVEGRFRQANREWERAIEIYSTLHTLYPDDLEHGLHLASVQSMAGRSDDALATLAGLRRLPEPSGSDPRIDLASARAAEAISDYPTSLEAARRAARQGEALDIHWLVAEARYLEGRALWRLGRLDDATAAAKSAEMLFLTLEDPRHRADSLALLANISENQGEREVARELYGEALEIHRRLGHQPGIASVLNNLAYVQSRLGDDAAALRSYEEALEIARSIDRKEDIARGLHNLALLRRRQGDLDTARQLFEQSLELAREIGNKNIESTSLNNLAGLARQRGEHELAHQLYLPSLELAREIGDKLLVASSLNNLGILNRLRGDLARAEEQLREARDVYLELGNERSANRRLTSLAVIHLRRGEMARARQLFDQVATALGTYDDERGRATLLESRAQLFLLEDRLDRAKADAETSIALHRMLGQETRVGKVETTLAFVQSASGEAHAALDDLYATVRRLAEEGPSDDELFARMALVEVLLAAGETERARQQVSETRALAAASGDFENRQLFELATARLELDEGQIAAAARRLATVLAESTTRDYMLLELEAETLLAEARFRLDGTPERQDALRAAAERARLRGYRLLARRTEERWVGMGD